MIHEAYPNFKNTQITVNKNLVCKPHKDKNKNDSYILFLGDFEGGELIVGDRTIKQKNKYHKFNGKFEHYNLAITSGTKYSIIWFSVIPNLTFVLIFHKESA